MIARNHALTTSYAGLAAQTIPSGVRKVEFWGVDAVDAAAGVAIFVKMINAGGTDYAVIPIAAGATYTHDIERSSDWTYTIKAAAGTPVANVVFS